VCNLVVHDLYSSPDAIREVKSIKFSVGCVVCIGIINKACRILVTKCKFRWERIMLKFILKIVV
jgi:hypothetical protein